MGSGLAWVQHQVDNSGYLWRSTTVELCGTLQDIEASIEWGQHWEAVEDLDVSQMQWYRELHRLRTQLLDEIRARRIQ